MEVVVRRMKEASLREKFKFWPSLFTSAHLANHCLKWAWLSDCQFRKVTKIVRGRTSNSGIGNMCGEEVSEAVQARSKYFF